MGACLRCWSDGVLGLPPHLLLLLFGLVPTPACPRRRAPQVRILSFGVMLFLPMTVAGLAVLLPINYTSDFYMVAPGEELDQYSSAFMRMTISNIQQHSPRLWCVRWALPGAGASRRGPAPEGAAVAALAGLLPAAAAAAAAVCALPPALPALPLLPAGSTLPLCTSTSSGPPG